MSSRYCLITADEIVVEDRVTFLFKHNSGADPAIFRDIPLYGCLRRREKGPEDINIFKAVRGEPDPKIGDRLEINIFGPDGGNFAMGIDDGEGAFAEIAAELPPCSLLVPKSEMERLRAALLALGHEVATHVSDRPLRTGESRLLGR